MKVALYARVSTQEQAVHGLSVDAQIHALDEWAKEYTIVDHYIDLGVSARSPASKRPELQRMLRDCEAGKIDLIAFTKLDRFFRNVKEYYKVEDVLEASHVSWRAIHEDYETETAAGRLKVNIMLAVAQDEADRTSERIKAVFERKRQMGLIPCGNAPFGFSLEGGKLVLQDENAIRSLFAEYIASRSLPAVARKFGVTVQGVRYILSNKVYLPIIGKDTWELVQSILQLRSQRHVRSDRVYLFSGLLICPNCGKRLTAVRSNGYNMYRCNRQSSGQCRGYNISEKKVERFLLSHIESQIEEFNITVENKKKRSVDVSALKRKQDKLTDLYMEDLISKEKYAEDFKELQAQIESAEAERKPIDIKEIVSFIDAYHDLSPTARKAFWSNLVKSVTPTETGFDFELVYT